MPGPSHWAYVLNVLRFAVAEGPILLADLDQIDQYIFSAQLQFLVKPVRDGFVEALLGLDRAAGIQGDLHEDAIVRALDAQIGAVELQARLSMLGDHLESVVL